VRESAGEGGNPVRPLLRKLLVRSGSDLRLRRRGEFDARGGEVLLLLRQGRVRAEVHRAEEHRHGRAAGDAAEGDAVDWPADACGVARKKVDGAH
jgi:hypothetical protein